MIYKCRNCGGNAVYSPEKHGMYCPYCDSEGSAERSDESLGELTVCPNCGGEVKVGPHTAASRCPSCDCYLIFNERVEGAYAPRMILPFQLGKEACKLSLRDRFRTFRFAPTGFLSEAKLNAMEGVYVPFWFYDYDTHLEFSGEGTKVRSWNSGDTAYTETSLYDVHRSMDIRFEKIPVDASEQMPDDVMDLVEPYRYEQLQAFDPQFLSGFLAEKYNMPAQDLESRAKQKRDEDAEKLLADTYAGSYLSVKTQQKDLQVRDSQVCYGLLPVWRYQYRYGGKDYPFYVNGQTGKIVGIPPVSTKKVWAYTGTLWACLTAILVLMQMIGSYL